MKSFEILVDGRVQGVGYRMFTKSRADLHGIKGYVRNLYDGRVKVMAIGNDINLDLFIKDLYQGPSFARVTNINLSEIKEYENYDSFRILY